MNNTPYDAVPNVPPVPRTPQEGNGLAIASMVLGILSFVLCGPLCSIPAVILGHMSLGRIRRGVMPPDSRNFALVGTIIGYVNIALVALGILWMMVFVGFAYFSGNAGHVSPFVYKL